MVWIICICILLIVVIILSYKLHQKLVIDNSTCEQLQMQVDTLSAQCQEKSQEFERLRHQCDVEETKRKQLIQQQEVLTALYTKQSQDQRAALANEATTLRQQHAEKLDLIYQQQENDLRAKMDQAQQEFSENLAAMQLTNAQLQKETSDAEEKLAGILAVLQSYDKEKQEKLFYTIQIPDEYKEDINFLITTVSQKVQHPDIINKLIWQEYIKPHLDNTFKRIGVKEESGIYKLTNLQDGKCYIGKSTNVKKRISDHFKSVVGIRAIADQAVHHAIWETGLWNWTIEIITYCDKEKLNELEKYYISFFKSQEFGYNRREGG